MRCFDKTPPTLNTLRRAFTVLTRWAFSSPEQFGGYEDILNCLTYNEDPKESKISIQPGSAQDPGDTQNIPGILIQSEQGLKFEMVGISPLSSMSEDTSRYTNSCLVHTNIKFLCRHKDADICCAMGDLITLFMFALHPRFFEIWGWLRKLDLVSQSEPAMQTHPSDSSVKWYESSVVISLIYEYNVFGARESKRLKDYTINVTGQSGLGDMLDNK